MKNKNNHEVIYNNEEIIKEFHRAIIQDLVNKHGIQVMEKALKN